MDQHLSRADWTRKAVADRMIAMGGEAVGPDGHRIVSYRLRPDAEVLYHEDDGRFEGWEAKGDFWKQKRFALAGDAAALETMRMVGVPTQVIEANARRHEVAMVEASSADGVLRRMPPVIRLIVALLHIPVIAALAYAAADGNLGTLEDQGYLFAGGMFAIPILFILAWFAPLAEPADGEGDWSVPAAPEALEAPGSTV